MEIKNLIANNEFIGWADVRCVILGKEVTGIMSLQYSDDVDLENVYGAGNMPLGISAGNYKASGAIGLYKEEITQLLLSIGTKYRIQDIAPFPIIVMYKYGGVVLKDILRGCKFKGNKVDIKQGDKTISNGYELLVSTIDWRLPV